MDFDHATLTEEQRAWTMRFTGIDTHVPADASPGAAPGGGARGAAPVSGAKSAAPEDGAPGGEARGGAAPAQAAPSGGTIAVRIFGDEKQAREMMAALDRALENRESSATIHGKHVDVGKLRDQVDAAIHKACENIRDMDTQFDKQKAKIANANDSEKANGHFQTSLAALKKAEYGLPKYADRYQELRSALVEGRYAQEMLGKYDNAAIATADAAVAAVEKARDCAFMIAAALAPAAGLGAGATVAVGAAAAAAVDLGKGYNAGAPFTETAFNIFWDTALAAIVPELKIPCVKGIAKFVDPYIRKNFHRLGQWHGAVSFIRKHIGDKHEVEKFEMTLKDLEAAHLEKDVEAHLIELIESYAVSQTFNRNMVDLLFDAGQQVLLAVLQTDYQIVVAKKPMTVGDAVKNFKSALGLGDWATLEAAKAHLGPIFEQAAQKMV